ncbi:chromate transporter [Rhizobium binxianense]
MNTPLSTSPASPISEDLQPATLNQVFIAFTKSAMMSIGGGLTGWMMREFVDKRRWLSETEFLTGLALAQALPGVNVVNLSIWVGFQLRGGWGAFVAALGMTVPPSILAIVILTLFDQVAHYHLAAMAIAGIAAAAIGLSLAMGVKAIRSTHGAVAPLVIIAAMVVTLFVLQWPLVPVLLVLVPVSIGQAFWRLRSKEKRS